MLRYRAFYFPLIVVLFFGLASSLISTNPVLGSNLPVGLTLQEPNLSPNSLVRYSHTLLVSSGGTPTENGTALLSARDIISNSNPSAANPYLLKLEPGNYALGNQSLTLLPNVDLEGSGEGTTTISSTFGDGNLQRTKATLIAASNSEVRFVKITNVGSHSILTAVLIPASATNARFTHATATTSGGLTSNVALYSDGQDITLADTTLTTFGGSNNASLYHNSGVITLTNMLLRASDGTGNNVALFDNGDEFQMTTVNNSTLIASGISFATALSAETAVINVNNSSLTATSRGSNNINQGIATGMLVNGGNAIVEVTNTDIKASAVAQSYGIFNRGGTHAISSRLEATGGTTSYGLNNLASANSALVIGSVLSGFTAPSNNLIFCPTSVNGRTLIPLNAACK